MIPAELSALIRGVVVEVFADNDLDTALVPDSVAVQRPKVAEHGDYASNIALQLAKRAGRAPRDLAEQIAKRLTERPGIGHVEVAGPGFLNVTLESAAIGELAGTVVAAGDSYGRTPTLTGQAINLEFVSANPTGPVHLGHSRWAAVGDSLHRILEAAGADVTAEHYINDAGTQLDHFARSLYARATGRPVPDDGYVGDYVVEVANRVVAAVPGILDQPEDAATAAFREHGYRLMVEEIAASLRRFRVEFDVWFSEQTLHSSGAVDRAIERLRAQGHVYEADGAVWLRTTDFGDDKDRVLVRGNGQYTYLAPDAAYYLDKRARGFDRCIYLLGADHHGYIGRLRTIVAAAGDDPDEHLEVQIGQLVHLVRGGEPLRLSKRAGTIATLDELIELVGVDAARYSLARSSTDSTLTLDVDEITKRTAENPVFYVQYAHARLASLRRNAAEYGLELGDGADWALLSSRWETDLLRALGDFPGVVATAAELRAPHRVARYLEELAGIYHRFYDNCRILPRGDEELTEHALPRLWLSEATRIVLRNGLDLLGVSAPERM